MTMKKAQRFPLIYHWRKRLNDTGPVDEGKLAKILRGLDLY